MCWLRTLVPYHQHVYPCTWRWIPLNIYNMILTCLDLIFCVRKTYGHSQHLLRYRHTHTAPSWLLTQPKTSGKTRSRWYNHTVTTTDEPCRHHQIAKATKSAGPTKEAAIATKTRGQNRVAVHHRTRRPRAIHLIRHTNDRERNTREKGGRRRRKAESTNDGKNTRGMQTVMMRHPRMNEDAKAKKVAGRRNEERKIPKQRHPALRVQKCTMKQLETLIRMTKAMESLMMQRL